MWMTGKAAGRWGQELISSIHFSRQFPHQAGTLAPLAAQFYRVDVGIAFGRSGYSMPLSAPTPATIQQVI